MSVVRSYAEVETWSVSNLIDATNESPSGNKKITIPEFQRRLVWSKDKQEKLILSIKNGYPFGSLLLYEDIATGNRTEESKRFYKLIDGLQRTQALLKYTDQPNTFFNRESIPDDFADIVVREFDPRSARSQDTIRRAIERWVKSLRGFSETDGWSAGDMTRMLVRELLDLEPDTDEFYMATGRASNNGLLQNALASFLKTIREDADISEAKIPVIIYTGPPSELPMVFELLNSQGTALSRYEIFAAQWIDERQVIANEKIIDAIWKKYEALEDEGFTLDITEQAPDSKTRRTREYSLFEYLFGFGQYLTSEFPNLFKSVAADRPSSAGFNLVSACSGLNVKDMDRLPDKIRKYDRSALEENILEAVTAIDEILSPILSVRQKGRSSISIYHSEFQIISMISTAFRTRFHLDDLGEIDGWKNQWAKLEQNLRMYYLYDIMRDYWRGSGDTKLHDDVQNMRYLRTPPSEATWRQTLETWFLDNQITLAHTKRYTRDQTPEILFLKYIYAHKLSVIKNARNYHIEHVVPVEQLTSTMADDERWPINAVSNLALLESTENTKKRNKTFTEYLEKLLADGKLTVDGFDVKLQEASEQLICPVDLLPEQINLDSFNNFLMNRFQVLVDEYVEVWRDSIPADPSAEIS
jgi:hypothetical protein